MDFGRGQIWWSKANLEQKSGDNNWIIDSNESQLHEHTHMQIIIYKNKKIKSYHIIPATIHMRTLYAPRIPNS